MNIEQIYLLSSIILIFAIMFAFQKHKALKLRFLTNLVIKSFLRKKEKLTGEKYFSSIGLKKLVKFLYNEKNKEAKRALQYLIYGKSSLALNYLQNKNCELSKYLFIVLSSFENEQKSIKEFEKLEVKNHILIELAVLYFLKNKIIKTKSLLEALLERKTGEKNNPEIEALALYYMSIINLKEGNLFLATENNNKAINLFEKTNLDYEYAKAMLLMGIIYRFAFIEDVAEVFFKSALEVFSSLKSIDGVADSYANLAMVNLNRELYETAIEQHKKAIEENRKIDRKTAIADSLNHLGLIAFIKKDTKNATKFLNEALEIHKEKDNKIGIAISYELLAQINFNNKNYRDAKEQISIAVSNNKKAKNISAQNDCSYLLAQILIKENKFDEAINILRNIIKICEKKENIFPIANAYSLLGVIYLKKGQLNRAKALLQKSLYKEMKNERIEAIACDYTNIGIIEFKKGNIKEARDNWLLASKLAKTTEDKELIKFLDEKLKEE